MNNTSTGQFELNSLPMPAISAGSERRQIATALTTRFGGLLLACLLVAISSCSDNMGGNVGGSSSNDTTALSQARPMSLAVPEKLLASRAIDLDALSVQVIANGESQSIDRPSNDTWVATVFVPSGQPLSLEITWSQIVDGQTLELASASDNIASVTENQSLSFDDEDYETQVYDYDGDGKSNLDEIDAGTDPLSSDIGLVSTGTLYVANLFDPTFSDGFIESVRTDGTNRSILLSPGGGLRGLAVDEPGNRLFWSDVDSDTINTLNLSTGRGSTVIDSDLLFAQDLDISPSASRIFWSDQEPSFGSGEDEVETANLDGSERSVILTSVITAAIAVDETNQKIYTEDRDTSARGSIVRANFDGTVLEVVVKNVPTVSGMAIDPVNQMIYWTSTAGLSDPFTREAGVYRVKFDGTEFEEIFLQGPGLATTSLALDVSNGHVYFGQETETATNASNIMRINLDGSNPQIVSTGYGNISDMEYVAD